mgnify:CR=1 FL=1
MNIDILDIISEYCTITDYIKILKYIHINKYILQKLAEKYKKDRERWLIIINTSCNRNNISNKNNRSIKKWIDKVNKSKCELDQLNIIN